MPMTLVLPGLVRLTDVLVMNIPIARFLLKNPQYSPINADLQVRPAIGQKRVSHISKTGPEKAFMNTVSRILSTK